MPSHKYLWHAFWGVCALIACVVMTRAWQLRLLYADPILRERSKTAMLAVAEREGWLLSDVALRAVVDTGFVVHHRRHMRGVDPEECFFIPFEAPDLFPCAL